MASWLEVLRSDKRFIVSAAAHAQRACDFLHALQSAAGVGTSPLGDEAAAA